MKTSRKFETASAVVIVALLVLAPVTGGKSELVGTAGLSVLALIAAGMLLWSRRMVRPVGLWPLVVFIGLLAASAAVTADLHATIESVLYFAACGVAALVASSVFREDKRFIWAPLAFAATGLLLGALGLREYKLTGSEWRVFGTFVSPGFFGGYLVLALPVTLASFFAGRSPAVVLIMGLAWGFESAALLLTGTRFAIVATVVSLAVFAALVLWTKTFGRRQYMRLVTVIALSLVAAGLAVAPTVYRVRGAAAAEQSHSGPFRVATWRGTANIIRAHPLLGTGAGTFEYVFPRYMVAGYTRMAHNGYLQLASEAGIPALLAALASICALLLAGLRALGNEGQDDQSILLPRGPTLLACGIIAAVVGSLARNLLDSDIYNPGIGLPFFVLAGLAAARLPCRKTLSFSTAGRVVITLLLAVMAVNWSLFVLGDLQARAALAAASDGDAASAIAAYRTATALDPLDADHWLRLGQVEALSAGPDETQWNQGIAHVEKSIGLEPTRARNAIVLARLLEVHGDTEGAVRAFRQSLKMDPHATPALLSLARLLKGPESEKIYRRLIEEENSPFEQLKGVREIVNPDYAWAHYYFGEKYLKAGRREEAAKEFKAAIDRLELRKSNKFYNEVAEVAGISDPGENKALDQLLEDCRARLAKIRDSGSSAWRGKPTGAAMLSYYTAQSIITEPGRFKYLYRGLPSDIPSLVKVVQGVLVHGGLLRLYENGRLTPRTLEQEQNLRKVEDMLKRITEMNAQPVLVTRKPEKRLQVSCRSFAVLTCSLLRHKGIPARVRAGYSTYTWGRGKYENHWICEFWSLKEKRWVGLDAQIDDEQRKLMGIDFDTLDVPPGKFLTGGEAWKLCRSGKASPSSFGLGGTDGFNGMTLEFVGEDVVRDFLALNKIEVLPWDENEFAKPREERSPEADDALLDRVAEITSGRNQDFLKLRRLYQSRTILQMPAGWKP